ncbi:GNAT family N-acetyltransferase [Paenibacillus sp. OK003]|uniref:GNAT family N-acetyltransferase n=1 Tax=Paenibacillus sp. OK003 TaxID=1884380 RepID=UPI0008BA717C|nr:GNAT family protein [Paenibacillus sp. OK003]SEL79068.1 Acetyltransferase (GNAT) domain-containing protein [Paenibacillus sp. OK003]
MWKAIRFSIIEKNYSTLKLNRIEAKVDPDNVNSIKLLEKLGFTCEGTLRQYERVQIDIKIKKTAFGVTPEAVWYVYDYFFQDLIQHHNRR